MIIERLIKKWIYKEMIGIGRIEYNKIFEIRFRWFGHLLCKIEDTLDSLEGKSVVEKVFQQKNSIPRSLLIRNDRKNEIFNPKLLRWC